MEIQNSSVKFTQILILVNNKYFVYYVAHSHFHAVQRENFWNKI